MNNQWTGGQYSLFRLLLGAYLIVHFLHLLPWAAELFSANGMIADADMSPLLKLFPNVLAVVDTPVFTVALVASGAVAAVFFTLGYGDKAAAIWMWYVMACLLGRNPLIANPAMPYVGWMLLAHLFIPGRPYGSLAASGRPDPGGQWTMPRSVYLAAWMVLAFSYSYSGYTKLFSPSWVSGDNLVLVLQNPLARDYFLREWFLALPDFVPRLITWGILIVELLFAPLALNRRLRPWIWSAMLIAQLGFLALLNFPDLTYGMLMIHLLTFDPAWLRSEEGPGVETVFYDGYCGLCHRVVRFVLAEDRRGRFVFAPQSAQAFADYRRDAGLALEADSLVVAVADGRTLMQSDAVVHILRRLGGLWRVLGTLISIFPNRLRDAAYQLVGRQRQRLFTQPEQVCPIVPKALAPRFKV